MFESGPADVLSEPTLHVVVPSFQLGIDLSQTTETRGQLVLTSMREKSAYLGPCGLSYPTQETLRNETQY
ncbi:hypothetical protein BgiBS90_004956, partial [Biomphalaria glabrata]